MKKFPILLVWLTTAYVFGFAALTQANVSLTLLSIMFAVGHIIILFMVYKVLADDFSTKKTFKDWYGDHPRNTNK